MKNMTEIRSMLSEEIERLRQKKSKPADLTAITNAVGKILSTVKLEIEYAKFVNGQPASSFIELAPKVLPEQEDKSA